MNIGLLNAALLNAAFSNAIPPNGILNVEPLSAVLMNAGLVSVVVWIK
jgi:hypothetical protein